MITLENIKVPYAEYDLNIPAFSKIAILGPSGAGKSTLLNIIAGFFEITPQQPNNKIKAKVLLDGKDHTLSLPGQRPVSMLFQNNNLIEHLSIYENIAIGLKPTLKLNVTEKEKLIDLAIKMKLDNLLNRKPEQLSGGQQQRVALARALLRQKPILLLDEPFSALDLELRVEMIELLNRVHDDNKLTTLMITHSQEDADLFAQNLIFINEGRIVNQT